MDCADDHRQLTESSPLMSYTPRCTSVLPIASSFCPPASTASDAMRGRTQGFTSNRTTATSWLTDDGPDERHASHCDSVPSTYASPHNGSDRTLFEGLAMDMAETRSAAHAGIRLDFCDDDDDSQEMHANTEDLEQCESMTVDTPASHASDCDADADHGPDLHVAPQLLDEQALSDRTSVPALPEITNEELEKALKLLNLNDPVIFPAGASRTMRKALVKQKLGDFALSLVMQLTLSTTPDRNPRPCVANAVSVPDSQYRTMQAKIAERGYKPKYDSVSLQVRNRHVPSEDQSLRCIRFPATVASTKQLAIVLRLLDLLTDCLAEEGPSTLRDIYYRDVKLFASQKVVDNLVDDIAATIGIRRWDLNVVATSKGLVHGFIRLRTDQGHDMDASSGSTGCLISPGEMIVCRDIDPDVNFVLVIEKEAVFQTLCASHFTQDPILGKSIIITGKGYPDIATRELVRALCIQLPERVPIMCLVDGDPHGMQIFLNYRDGSKAMSFDNENLVASRLQWLGLSAQDIASIPADKEFYLPLSIQDIRKGLSLLQLPDLDADIRRHIQHLLHLRVKAEIQLLASEDAPGLLCYLRNKIHALIPV